jgi:hypothetical protein
MKPNLKYNIMKLFKGNIKKLYNVMNDLNMSFDHGKQIILADDNRNALMNAILKVEQAINHLNTIE